jgi:chromosome segregation ATPase
MTKTKETTLVEKLEDARAEIAATERRVGELQVELNSIPAKIAATNWDDEEQAVLEVAALERRRDALPHYLKHLRRQLIEQKISSLNLEMEEAENQRAPLSEKVAAKQEAFDKAREELNRVKGEHHELVYGLMSDIRRGISQAEKRLHTLESEPTEAGPPVLSRWQANMQNPGPENAIQDTPDSFRFGSANVADKPTSEETPAAVVIPQNVADKRDRAG